MAWLLSALGGLSLLIWLYLIAGRGGFWRARERLPTDAGRTLAEWPAVVAIVPARDEAEVIGPAISSLLRQDYPGRLHVLLVDDHSGDATAHVASEAALAAGWSGKIWALAEGERYAAEHWPKATYLWLSDADIAHQPGNLRRLVGKAEADRCDLVSLMVALSSRAFWEQLLIPPFVYFFQMLYPFAWVNDPRRRTAAAAGGCVLLRRAAHERIGGFAALKGVLIDDCALARLVKRSGHAEGRIWLGLADSAHSIRPYRGLGDIWRMVARSAYTQLRYSPWLLAGTLLAMAVTFLAPPVLVFAAPWHGEMAAFGGALGAWVLMSLSARPTLAVYGLPAWRSLLLPVAAALYCAMTADSAWRHWRGVGGAWKGRTHPAPAASAVEDERLRL